MRFHATNKLLTAYKKSLKQNKLDAPTIEDVETLSSNRDELYDWHASLVEIKDKYFVAFINDLTQFPIVTGPFSTEELANAFEVFKESLKEVMAKQQFDADLISDYVDAIQPITLTKSISRKKLGPLSAVIIDLNGIIEEKGINAVTAEGITDFLGDYVRVKGSKAFIPVENWFDAWVEKTGKKGFSSFTNEQDDEWVPAHDEPENHDWTNLYKVIDQIKKDEPWQGLDDTQWIAVTNPHTGEKTYVSIMGREGVFKGLGLYTGKSGLRSLYRIIEQDSKLPNHSYHTVQDGILISFIEDKEMVDDDNLNRLNKLNLLSKDDKLIPEVLKYTPGFIPWSVLTESEVEWTTTVLNQLLAVLDEKDSTDIPKVSSGKIVNRIEKDSKWTTEIVDLPDYQEVKENKEPVQFRNDLARYQIKRAPKANNTVLIDIAHTQAVIQEHPHERPFYPVIALCAERGSGKVINFKTLSNQSHLVQEIYSMLAEVSTQGKPKEIIVREESIGWIVEDFCKKNKIKFKVAKELPEIDAVMDDLNKEIQ